LFAEAKDWHGLRRFRLRRLEKVNIEALLIACRQNIKRLVAARERGSAEAGTGGGLASTGSTESLQVSCDWTVAFLCWSKGVFQQAVDLRRDRI
jgi:hypothetical protein